MRIDRADFKAVEALNLSQFNCLQSHAVHDGHESGGKLIWGFQTATRCIVSGCQNNDNVNDTVSSSCTPTKSLGTYSIYGCFAELLNKNEYLLRLLAQILVKGTAQRLLGILLVDSLVQYVAE